MIKKGHVISKVLPGSIAEEMDLEPGDILIAINNTEIEDVFDYHYLTNDDRIELLVQKADGEEWELEIEKEYEEELGIEFESGLMDEYKSCTNKCMFCFIDQMPEGMRETLYFKDDDSRLSFLQGNYITLTNMSDHDIDRIIAYKLSPINISFHTTNPELRCKMLSNRFAGEALRKVDRLNEAGIIMNGQIVLCKGVNDGKELERSIGDLVKYISNLQSVSVVPVGLTKFREGLYPLEPFNREEAAKVLKTIHGWQQKLREEYGTSFIHAGDEWYILAGEEVPEAGSYDGYLQLENGVGMVRLLVDEVDEELSGHEGDDRKRHISLATGVLAYDIIRGILDRIEKLYPNVKTELYKIENNFFGTQITVSGLLTGRDIIDQLRGKALGTKLLLPCNVLRSGEDVFLDDVTLRELENALQVPADIVKSSGRDLVQSILK